MSKKRHSRSAPLPSPRRLAWDCLCKWDANPNVFADTLIQRAGSHLGEKDRAMLQSLVLGTLRHLQLLDYTLTTIRGKRHLQKDARWLLLCALCQLLILDYPEYAVVNESVKLAPQKLRPVINGILRTAARQRDQWQAELSNLPLALRYSMPEWLVERWLTRFGKQDCEELLQSLQQPARVYVRLNAIRPPEVIPADWQALTNAPNWYALPDGNLPFQELKCGQVYIADPSTRYSVELLAPAKGEKILDCCAAPGGKSAAILSHTHGECFLLATDAEKSRIPMLRQNLERTGAHAAVHVQCCDWTAGCPQALLSQFNAVLVDVPCSNTGVLRRRVDVRHRISIRELKRLTDVQLSIAEHAMQAVCPGGRLVYSTCSIEPEEDSELVQHLLKLHPEWHLAAEQLVLPHREGTDGAYAALLIAPSQFCS